MHVVDGALSAEVLIVGAAATVGGVAMGLRHLPMERIPAAGLLSAVFFVASLIHVPVGPASAHLVMSGLAGLALGWAAFPAILTAVALQAVFFGFGGITALGVNVAAMAAPAVLFGLIVRRVIVIGRPKRAALWGGAVGAGAILCSALLVAAALWASGAAFAPAAKLVVLSHLPVAAIEGFICAAAVLLISRLKPELLIAQDGRPA